MLTDLTVSTHLLLSFVQEFIALDTRKNSIERLPLGRWCRSATRSLSIVLFEVWAVSELWQWYYETRHLGIPQFNGFLPLVIETHVNSLIRYGPQRDTYQIKKEHTNAFSVYIILKWMTYNNFILEVHIFMINLLFISLQLTAVHVHYLIYLCRIHSWTVKKIRILIHQLNFCKDMSTKLNLDP